MVEIAARQGPAVPSAAWLVPLPPAIRLAFQGGATAQAAASPVWGLEFPQVACRAHTDGRRATLWLGPEEYLLLDANGEGTRDTPPIWDGLARALGDLPHSLVDVSHRQFAIEVSGPHAAVILNGACPLDLDPAEFPVGMCTRTVLAKADIVLWRTREDVFHVEAWRSFAGYVTGLLREIAAEFHGERS